MSKEHSLYHHFQLFLKNKFSQSPFKISFLDEKILKLGTKGKLQSRTLLGKKVYFKDGYSYLSSINEVFVNHCYKFVSDNPKPIIIDCGANIGISVIYFKQFYPDSTVIAFEPDSSNFELLEKNVSAFQFSGVSLFKKAVWIHNDSVSFLETSSQESRIENSNDSKNSVPAARLKDYLQSPVDLLKIDIEGAEYDVLMDCAENLKNVKNLFVEYHSFLNQEQRLSGLLLLLRTSGFRYFIQEAYPHKMPGFEQFEQTENPMDLQLNIYAKRID